VRDGSHAGPQLLYNDWWHASNPSDDSKFFRWDIEAFCVAQPRTKLLEKAYLLLVLKSKASWRSSRELRSRHSEIRQSTFPRELSSLPHINGLLSTQRYRLSKLKRCNERKGNANNRQRTSNAAK
jgi:hypothetical protein